MAKKSDSVPSSSMSKHKEKPTEENVVDTPGLLGRNLIIQEIYNPETRVASFSVRNFENSQIRELGEIKDESKNTVYRPVVDEILRKRLVLLPVKPVQCTFEQAYQEGCELALEIYDCEPHKEEELKFLTGVSQATWFYDRFNPDPILDLAGVGKYAPIIAFRGASGGGKDRALNALRFNSFRPFLDVSTDRIPSLFRPLDRWKGTLCLSEMDMARTDETSPLIHYLNCRSYGVPIARQNPEKGRISEAFDNFGLTVITQRRVFDDNGTEDRTLPFYTEKSQAPIPTTELNEWIERGIELQNKLHYLRMTYWDKITIEKSARIQGIKDHRLTASVLPILAIGKLAPSFLKSIKEILGQLERKRKEVKAQSKDGVIINLLWDYINEGLVDKHNGACYVGKEMTKDKEGGDAVVPLQVSEISKNLEWTSRQVRSVVHSLQLASIETPATTKLILGDKKNYRPIWFTHDRMEPRLREFVVDYKSGDLSEIITPPIPQIAKRTSFEKMLLGSTNVGEQDGGVPVNRPVPSVPSVTQTSSETGPGTDGTHVTVAAGLLDEKPPVGIGSVGFQLEDDVLRADLVKQGFPIDSGIEEDGKRSICRCIEHPKQLLFFPDEWNKHIKNSHP